MFQIIPLTIVCSPPSDGVLLGISSQIQALVLKAALGLLADPICFIWPVGGCCSVAQPSVGLLLNVLAVSEFLCT